ncbi:putative alcohol dehydrogenase protein [Favolaschia claudopus]|uniref:Alcohol dehydrogenase protein n=1 Tax=Favolaschia claudopus TaxID=2862362 RepID=A0AAW0BEA0_9AGAR
MNRETKAWTFTYGGYPKALAQSTLPLDARPLQPSEIQVRVKAASLNPVDAQLMGYPLLPQLMPKPKGVGEDFSGVVEQAGAKSGFKAGDEVFGMVDFLSGGTLRETMRINTEKAAIVRKPTDWSWEQAAALPLVWLTAKTAIARAAPYVKNGKIAVLGGGSSSGMYAVYLANQRGWTVITTCSAAKAELVRSLGASEIVDYTKTDVRQGVKALEPDAIIDCVGGKECVGIAKRYVTIVGDKTDRLSPGGMYTYFWNPQMMLRALSGTIGLGRSYTCINLELKQSLLEDIVQLPKDKIIIDSCYGFYQVKEAFDKLKAGRTTGKIMITVEAA